MEQDDIQTKLTQKLFMNLVTQGDKRFVDKYTSYFMRLLNSRLNVTTNNETNIINLIIDRTSKSQNALEKAERIQNLYSNLVNKKTLKRRWAILYLFYRISSDTNEHFVQDSSKILQSIFQEESMSINSIPNMHLFNNVHNVNNFNPNENIYDEEENEKAKSQSSVIVVNTLKSNKIITEKDLINDLIFVFQGIDGHYINYNSIANAYTLNPLIPFIDNVYDIVSFLSELGWLYKKVNNYLNFFNESNIPSQFIQSFSFAIKNELSEYYKLISLFKKMNSKIEELNVNSNVEELSLKKLVLWTLEPMERMKWLAASCEAIYTLRGIPILSQIYSYVHYCGAEKILNKLLEETSKPLFVFIKNWLIYGELQDPYREFFVEVDEKVSEDDIWTNRYVLISKNIPNFFHKTFVQKIFEIGKCVNFIRKFCNQPTYSLMKLKTKFKEEMEKIDKEYKNKMMIDNDEINLNSNKNENYNNDTIYIRNKKCLKLMLDLEDDLKLNLNLLPDLCSEIDIIYNEINTELISIIYDKFKFYDNLNSINRYLLLGQGDMMQYLMDLLFNELKKPATQIYKHNLLSILETAIRASNAQYHDQDCLKRLNIKLMDSSTGDTGWDIFVLEYNVDVPLNVIFSRKLLKEYQKLFFFFWKLKRLEFSQDHQIWRNFMTYSHSLKSRFEHLRPYIQKSMLFNQQIIHFVSNLHNYIALEVLETEYKKLLEKLPNIKKLDDLIFLHQQFLESVIEQSLLNSEYSLLYKKILQIFDLIFRFKTAQDVLITTLFEEYYRNIDSFNNSGREYNEYDEREIKFSKEAYNQISVLFEDFKNEITELINNLELIGKGNLKFLAMKLDYNYYYSEREIQNLHKKQRQQFEDIDDNEAEENNENEDYYEDGYEVENQNLGSQNEQLEDYSNTQFYSSQIQNRILEENEKDVEEVEVNTNLNLQNRNNNPVNFNEDPEEEIKKSYTEIISDSRRFSMQDFINNEEENPIVYDKNNSINDNDENNLPGNDNI